MPKKLWYEKPIKLVSIPQKYTVIENGENGDNILPARHYWSSHEEQQADIADLWVVITELQFEAVLAALGPLSRVGEPSGDDDSSS